MAVSQMAASDQLHDALIAKGYHCINRYGLLKPPAKFLWVYAKQETTLLLYEWDDGGCALYRPVANTLSITDTIAAIP